MNTQLYAVKDHPGAHLFIEMRDTDSGTWARMHLIGAPLPFDARPEDCTPYNPAEDSPQEDNTAVEIWHKIDSIVLLAQRAAIQYRLDPPRIIRACNILRAENPGMVKECEGYLQITSSNMRQTYRVTKGLCECHDHSKGNICKHRIAAWMYRELHPTPTCRYFERRYCMECLCEHWLELTRYEGEKCHGETFDPLHIPNTYTSGRNTSGLYVHPMTHIHAPRMQEAYVTS
jgi:hypothetical protein